jgi:hypothetical protein
MMPVVTHRYQSVIGCGGPFTSSFLVGRDSQAGAGIVICTLLDLTNSARGERPGPAGGLLANFSKHLQSVRARDSSIIITCILSWQDG